jgi:hydrogenase expression/formation protein HypD
MADAAPAPEGGSAELRFRDPRRARALLDVLARRCAAREGRPLTLMHVCGSHEQAIARFGLRAALPRGLEVLMGPGCPVCVTDAPEVDEAVALADAGVRVATYGDMLRVPGSGRSLADARADGARVEVVYGAAQAAELAARGEGPLVFFATGFETTAVATAAVLLAGPPEGFFVLSAHKYVPPAMELVAAMPGRRVEGFLAAGHAATITGWGVFEPFAQRHRLPVVVAGFEPLDILAGLALLADLVLRGESRVVNAYPRCVTREGNRAAQRALFEVFEPTAGPWRGIARVPGGDLRLREEWARFDARRRFGPAARRERAEAGAGLAAECRCGEILIGAARPSDCRHFGRACTPHTPVGACMVSSEGACRIWHQYGGHPSESLRGAAP